MNKMKIESWQTSEKTFIYENNEVVSYGRLYRDLQSLKSILQEKFLARHAFLVEAENTYSVYLKNLALLELGHIVFPSPSYQFLDESFRKFIHDETSLNFVLWSKEQRAEELASDARAVDKNFLNELNIPATGLFIVRTSGSSGKKFKLVLHDYQGFLRKYQKIGPHFKKTFAFSPAESIAGMETVLEALSHQAELVVAGDRVNPAIVAELLARYQVDYFQTTPTFLNLLVMSGQVAGKDLSALKKIAYGSEPAQLPVLKALKKSMPQIEFMHTYGMSEIGIQKTFTNQEDPSVFRLDVDMNPARLVDGMIQIQSLTPMICYLNELESPFEGKWFKTFDVVNIEGDFWRVVGRTGDLINLAGRKFFPSEVESLILEMDEVQDVTIIKEVNDFIGNILIARIVILPEMDEQEFRKKFKDFCEKHVPFYMHPHRVLLSKESSVTNRFKKIRRT